MTTNHLLLFTEASMQPCEGDHLPGTIVCQIHEDSYRPDYSLQESKPVDAEYTSYHSEEKPIPSVSQPSPTRSLSYAERRLRNHL